MTRENWQFSEISTLEQIINILDLQKDHFKKEMLEMKDLRKLKRIQNPNHVITCR